MKDRVTPYGAYVVFIVMLGVLMSYLDRQVLTLLLQPLKGEFGLTDTALGLLTGFAFAVFYPTLRVPIARLADRTSRVLIIGISMSVWSAATVGSAFATSFEQLVIARIFVGIGEAGFLPAAISLVADYIPVRHRGTALAVTQAGTSLGMMAGLLLGAVGLQLHGWRGAFLIAGSPGLVIAALFCLTVREPRDTSKRERGPVRDSRLNWSAAIADLWQRRTYRYVLIANCLSACVIFGSSSWFPAFLMRSFSLPPSSVGYLLAPAFAIAGTVGLVAGGAIGDRLSARSVRLGLQLCAVASLLAIPLIAASLSASYALRAVVFFGGAYCLGMIYAGPSVSIVCRAVPSEQRAFAISLLLAAMNLVGLGIGPLLVGRLADSSVGHPGDLKVGMIIEALFYVPAAVMYVLASRAAVRESARMSIEANDSTTANAGSLASSTNTYVNP